MVKNSIIERLTKNQLEKPIQYREKWKSSIEATVLIPTSGWWTTPLIANMSWDFSELEELDAYIFVKVSQRVVSMRWEVPPQSTPY
jgi:hypothetical protein